MMELISKNIGVALAENKKAEQQKEK